MSEAQRGHRLRQPVGDEDHVRGPTEAPVTLVEYGDYQCPTCQAAHQEVEQLLGVHGGQVRFVFRHFPLMSMHERALPAAMAAEAAGRQGKFWEMHGKLFESRGQLADADLRDYANDIGLDLARFDADRTDEQIERAIREQRLQGARSGVNGTPTFFVNGDRHDGRPSFEALAEAVREAMG
jgi:protein-disulfide isomerase